MIENTEMQGNITEGYVAGTPVYDAGGEKVGTVTEYSPQWGYLAVEKGWLFPKDLYIPLEAIAGNYADGIHLKYYKEDLKAQNWDNPPAVSTTADDVPTGPTARDPTGGPMVGAPGPFPGMGTVSDYRNVDPDTGSPSVP